MIGDPWWEFQGAVDDFNTNRNDLIKFSNILTLDESMAAYRPRTTQFGGLPHLTTTYMDKKPKWLGLQIKNKSCATKLKILTYLEIDDRRGAKAMKRQLFHKEIVGVLLASCSKHLVEGNNQMKEDGCNEIVIADSTSWFFNGIVRCHTTLIGMNVVDMYSKLALVWHDLILLGPVRYAGGVGRSPMLPLTNSN